MNLSGIIIPKLTELDNYFNANKETIIELLNNEDNNGLSWDKWTASGFTEFSLINIAQDLDFTEPYRT